VFSRVLCLFGALLKIFLSLPKFFLFPKHPFSCGLFLRRITENTNEIVFTPFYHIGFVDSQPSDVTSPNLVDDHQFTYQPILPFPLDRNFL
jgi:hypothetical protein